MLRPRFFVLSICCGVLLSLNSAEARNPKPTKTLSYDADARVVGLFEGMRDGELQVRGIPQSALESNVLIRNKTDKPLTVTLPTAVVGIHVFNQQFPQQPFQPFPGNNQNNNNQGPGQNVGGQVQAAGPNGFPQLPGNFQGQNLFSIPAGHAVILKLESVCLQHGKPDPVTKMKYNLIPTEVYAAENPALQYLLEDFNPATDRKAVQAAAWHVANNMSWEELQKKRVKRIVGIGELYFTAQQIQSAQQLVKAARAKVEKSPAKGSIVSSTR